ncbi:hypothetical protein AALO_G00160240 [Alosa alosa]|uniref:Uncharacterized protein n=1 Tax=Alosa alosa TaxID=278164 RepID=A0AAV6GAW0_9TELE|nr:hypothetical protein AALO_G00160240 [Alosa alosa]
MCDPGESTWALTDPGESAWALTDPGESAWAHAPLTAQTQERAAILYGARIMDCTFKTL